MRSHYEKVIPDRPTDARTTPLAFWLLVRRQQRNV